LRKYSVRRLNNISVLPKNTGRERNKRFQVDYCEKWKASDTGNLPELWYQDVENRHWLDLDCPHLKFRGRFGQVTQFVNQSTGCYSQGRTRVHHIPQNYAFHRCHPDLLSTAYYLSANRSMVARYDEACLN
jgi:hypothetical protein